MDYRRYVLPCAIFLLIALLPACGGNSPDAVVARFLLATAEGDTEKAKRYCTENFEFPLVYTWEQMKTLMPGGATGTETPSTQELLETLETSIQGNTARVWATDAPFVKYVLVKQGASWKIDSIELITPP